MRRSPLILALLAGLAASPVHARSGRIGFVSGDVQIGKESHLRKAALADDVKPGDTVRTGPDSLAIVLLDDQSQIKLKAASEITLGSGAAADEVVLRAGGVFSEVRKQDPAVKKRHFFLRTRAAVMGVRGTRFFASYGDAGAHAQDVWMCVDDGVVSVQVAEGAPATTTRETLVNAGLGVFVPAGKAPTEPKPYAWTKSLNWNMDPGKGDVTDRSQIKAGYRDLLNQNYD